ncbi:HNH endonuclease signature motif containing protein [Corynebacterium frankenforstense]
MSGRKTLAETSRRSNNQGDESASTRPGSKANFASSAEAVLAALDAAADALVALPDLVTPEMSAEDFAVIVPAVERLEKAMGSKELVDEVVAHLAGMHHAGDMVGSNKAEQFLVRRLGLSRKEAFDRIRRAEMTFGEPRPPRDVHSGSADGAGAGSGGDDAVPGHDGGADGADGTDSADGRPQDEQDQQGAQDRQAGQGGSDGSDGSDAQSEWQRREEEEQRRKREEWERLQAERREAERRRAAEEREKARKEAYRKRVAAEKKAVIASELEELLPTARPGYDQLLREALEQADRRGVEDLRDWLRHRVRRANALARDPFAGRRLRKFWIGKPDAHGGARIGGYVPAETLALIESLVSPARRPGFDFPEGVEMDDARTLDQRRADALHQALLHAASCDSRRRGAASVVVSFAAPDLTDLSPEGAAGAGTGDGDSRRGAGADGADGGAEPGDSGRDGGDRSDDRGGCDSDAEDGARAGGPEGSPNGGGGSGGAGGAAAAPGVSAPPGRSPAGPGPDLPPDTRSLAEVTASAGRSPGGLLKTYPTNTRADLDLFAVLQLQAARHDIMVLHNKDGNPLIAGRAYRSATFIQKAALVATELVCSFPGCTQRAEACDVHHIIAFFLAGRTDIENLTLRCRTHHTDNNDRRNANLARGWAARGSDGRIGQKWPGSPEIEYNETAQAQLSAGARIRALNDLNAGTQSDVQSNDRSDDGAGGEPGGGPGGGPGEMTGAPPGRSGAVGPSPGTPTEGHADQSVRDDTTARPPGEYSAGQPSGEEPTDQPAAEEAELLDELRAERDREAWAQAEAEWTVEPDGPFDAHYSDGAASDAGRDDDPEDGEQPHLFSA